MILPAGWQTWLYGAGSRLSWKDGPAWLFLLYRSSYLRKTDALPHREGRDLDRGPGGVNVDTGDALLAVACDQRAAVVSAKVDLAAVPSAQVKGVLGTAFFRVERMPLRCYFALLVIEMDTRVIHLLGVCYPGYGLGRLH